MNQEMKTLEQLRQEAIAAAKANPQAYKFMYVQSAVVMLNGTMYSDPKEDVLDYDAMLKELGID